MTVDFVRSPDNSGAGGKGRYLFAVNSGFGVQFNSKSKNQQTLSVIDTEAKPEPQVVQNVYFPSPNSAKLPRKFSVAKPPVFVDKSVRVLSSITITPFMFATMGRTRLRICARFFDVLEA